jgi:co-chaperonin GroES (HSP10)
MSVEEAIRENEESIDRIARRNYQIMERRFTPLYPWIFCRVLPKEQVINGIIIPEIEQNKTVHEGIVLATWQPFELEVQVDRVERQQGDKTIVSYIPKAKTVRRSSSLKPGDHVLFAHWAGAPIYGAKEKYYRVIKEEGWRETQDGGVIGTVEYDNNGPVEQLIELLDSLLVHEWAAIGTQKIAEDIAKRFLLVDRKATSVTLSGR